MRCKYCKNDLRFKDNSLQTANGKYGEVRPVYYCNVCRVVFDGYELDCNNKYVKISRKYIKWFENRID